MSEAQERLGELRHELESGRRELELLDLRRTELRDTLLRISGAIQILEELAASENGASVPLQPLG